MFDNHLLYLAGLAIFLYLCTNKLLIWFASYRSGCKPIRKYKGDGLFGFSLALKLIKRRKEGTIVDALKDRLEDANVDTVGCDIAGISFIITKNPDNIKTILATKFDDYSLGTRHSFFKPLLGDGIFTLDNDGWKHSRAMLRPQFVREQVSQVKYLESHVQDLTKHILHSKGEKIDIQELFFRLTLDSATEFLFGESVLSLVDESISDPTHILSFEGKDKFADSFNKAQHYLSIRATLQSFYFLVNNREFRQCVRNVNQFTDHYVRKALSMSQEELEHHSRDGYIFLYELAKKTKDPKVLRDQSLNILLAGRDTTAGLLSFSFFELARNPDVWTKLKKEIYDRFGYGENPKLEEITFESLKKCGYLKAVINETLRLYPSVPTNYRVAKKNTSLPYGGGPKGNDPVFVPKNTSVLYSIFSTHRDTKYYGKDADIYRPERWFDPEMKGLGWAYLPFNGGPRICLGQQFALTEASYVIVRLIQTFPHISSFCEEYPPKKMSHLTMSHFEGVFITLTK